MINKQMKPTISVVLPAKDEEGSVEILYNELIKVLNKLKHPFEIIYVDDGSTDETFSILLKLHKKDARIKIIKLRGNFGKSIALQSGFEQSQGDIIFTLDADLQDNPEEIPSFLMKLDEGYDLVSGWKKKRHDPSFGKVLPSRVINFLTRLLSRVKIHDTNCGFKVYKREVVDNLNLYGELYRFIPIIAAKQNFRVGELIIDHRQRIYGKSKFGWRRGIKGILDLLTVIFLTDYGRRPGHFFGTFGIISFFLGFCIGLYITYLRLTTGGIQYRQPLLFLGILLIIIGIQFISTGLLAEMIIASKQKTTSREYIKEILF